MSIRAQLKAGTLFNKPASLSLEEKLDLAYPAEPYENFILNHKL